MFFEYDYVVNDFITIHQPKIGDIIEFGESKVNLSIMPFVTNPTTHRLSLWDKGIDWNKISDYDLFLIMVRHLTKEETSLIFGGFDFSKLLVYSSEDGKESILCNTNGELVIDEETYLKMSSYIRTMFNQFPKVEKAKGKNTKEWIIEEERMSLNGRANDRNEQDYFENSHLMPLISFLLNHPGFKYNKAQLKEIGIVEFMDSVKRLQVYESLHAFSSGIYSGMLDVKKIDIEKELDWLKDL